MNRNAVLFTVALVSAVPMLASAQSISKVNGRAEVAAGQTVDEVSTVNGAVSIANNAIIKDDVSVVNGSVQIGDGVRSGEISAVNGSVQAGSALHAESVSTVNGRIEIGANADIKEDVSSVNGEILIRQGSRVGGDVTTVNGAIGLIATQVGGDLESVNGNATVGINSVINGGIVYHAPKGISIGFAKRRPPRVIIGPNAQVKGDLKFEREVKLYVHSTARIGKVSGATVIPYSGDTAPSN